MEGLLSALLHDDLWFLRPWPRLWLQDAKWRPAEDTAIGGECSLRTSS